MASNLDDLAEAFAIAMVTKGWIGTGEDLANSAYAVAQHMLLAREKRATKPVEVKPAPPTYEPPFWIDELFHNGAEWVARKKLGGEGGGRAATGRSEEDAVQNLASLMRAEGIPFNPKQ